jgi:predicted translin family RNA/ssDNA-binding protein
MADSLQLFADFQQYISQEQDVREEIRKTVRELDKTSREILNVLQMIHQTAGVDSKELCLKSKEKFVAIQDQYAELQRKVPSNEYYRYVYPILLKAVPVFTHLHAHCDTM